MSKIKCNECGAENPENVEICQECGKSLIKQIGECLDITNPDTKTCEEPNNGSNKVLWYSAIIVIIIILAITFFLFFYPTGY